MWQTKLKAEARLAGRPFREIVKETLRAAWRIGASRPTGRPSR
jgi:hypothetical protein